MKTSYKRIMYKCLKMASKMSCYFERLVKTKMYYKKYYNDNKK